MGIPESTFSSRVKRSNTWGGGFMAKQTVKSAKTDVIIAEVGLESINPKYTNITLAPCGIYRR